METFYDDYESGKSFLHSHTYCGNALAASVALAALSVIKEEKLCARAEQLQVIMMQYLTEVAEKSGQLVNLRGIGALVAADLVEIDGKSRLGYAVFQEAVKRGAFLRPMGNTIYWLPPLNVSIETLKELRDITLDSILAVCSSNNT